MPDSLHSSATLSGRSTARGGMSILTNRRGNTRYTAVGNNTMGRKEARRTKRKGQKMRRMGERMGKAQSNTITRSGSRKRARSSITGLDMGLCCDIRAGRRLTRGSTLTGAQLSPTQPYLSCKFPLLWPFAKLIPADPVCLDHDVLCTSAQNTLCHRTL
jgi:hypothetical protein